MNITARILLVTIMAAALVATYVNSGNESTTSSSTGLRKLQLVPLPKPPAPPSTPAPGASIRAPVGNGLVIKPVTGDLSLITAVVPTAGGNLGAILASPLVPAASTTPTDPFAGIPPLVFGPFNNDILFPAPTKTGVGTNNFATGALAIAAFAQNPGP